MYVCMSVCLYSKYDDNYNNRSLGSMHVCIHHIYDARGTCMCSHKMV